MMNKMNKFRQCIIDENMIQISIERLNADVFYIQPDSIIILVVVRHCLAKKKPKQNLFTYKQTYLRIAR